MPVARESMHFARPFFAKQNCGLSSLYNRRFLLLVCSSRHLKYMGDVLDVSRSGRAALLVLKLLVDGP